MKKKLSMLLATVIALSTFGGLNAMAVTSYEDTVPAEKPVSAWASSHALYEKNNGNMTLVKSSDNLERTYTFEKEAATGKQWHIFSGERFISAAGKDGASGRNVDKFEKGKTYVYQVGVKNNNPSVDAYYGIAYLQKESYAFGDGVASNYYGIDGMKVTATEDYQLFKDTITIGEDWNDTKTFTQSMHQGMSYKSPLNASIIVNIGTEYRYFAEEIAYDLTVEPAGKTIMGSGESIDFKAEVVNQIEIPGTLNQDVTWKVLNEDRSTEVNTITVVADGNIVTLTADESTADGMYTVVALSDTYGFVQGCEFEVVNDLSSKYNDNVPVQMPENLLTSKNAFTQQNGGDTFTNNLAVDSTVSYKSNDNTAGQDMYVFSGSSLLAKNAGGHSINLDNYKANTTYVFRTKVKNTTEDTALGNPYYGIAWTTTYGYNNGGGSNEYGKAGMEVTSRDWMDFKATITYPENWNEASTASYIQTLHTGISYRKTPVGGRVTVSASLDDAYLAEEVPYDIALTADEGTTVVPGVSADFTAEIVNQIGIKGTLAQDIKAVVLNTDRTEIMENITATVDGNTVTVTANEGVTGTYTLVVMSDAYDFVKGIDIEVAVVNSVKYKDFEAPEMPANLLTNKSAFTQQNGGDTFTNNLAVDSTVSYKSKDNTAGQDMYVFSGSSLVATNAGGHSINLTNYKANTTYVYKTKVKNTTEDTTLANPYYGIAWTKTYGYNNGGGSNEYGKAGMEVTSRDWMDFKATITFPVDWNEASTANYIQTLHTGISYRKTPVGGQVTVSASLDDAYLAEEVLYNITNEATAGDTTLVKGKGDTITLSASLTNQIGLEGGLNQDVTWVALSKDRNDIIDTITITKNADGTATVSAENAPVDNYVIVAYSENYKVAKGIDITVEEKKEISLTSFELLQDSGYAFMNAKVENAECDKIMFAIASYETDSNGKEKLTNVTMEYVNVVNGVAEIGDFILKDADGIEVLLEDGTVVKAFVWTDSMQPIVKADNKIVIGAEAEEKKS